MRAFDTLVLIAGLGLAGCATGPAIAPATPLASNGLLVALSPASLQKLIGDASGKLRALYPAASTQFELKQATPDAFGSGLVESLRSSGYAVLEAAHAAQHAKQSDPGPVAPSSTAARDLALRYIVDAPADLNLYRVTLLVGSSSLSRAYMVATDSSLQPAGAWVRKE